MQKLAEGLIGCQGGGRPKLSSIRLAPNSSRVLPEATKKGTVRVLRLLPVYSSIHSSDKPWKMLPIKRHVQDGPHTFNSALVVVQQQPNIYSPHGTETSEPSTKLPSSPPLYL